MQVNARLRRVETAAAERRAANYWNTPEGRAELGATLYAMDRATFGVLFGDKTEAEAVAMVVADPGLSFLRDEPKRGCAAEATK